MFVEGERIDVRLNVSQTRGVMFLIGFEILSLIKKLPIPSKNRAAGRSELYES
jgi:hypothetical protein